MFLLSVLYLQRGSPEGEAGGQETEEERRDKPPERRPTGDNNISQDKTSPGTVENVTTFVMANTTWYY